MSDDILGIPDRQPAKAAEVGTWADRSVSREIERDDIALDEGSEGLDGVDAAELSAVRAFSELDDVDLKFDSGLSELEADARNVDGMDAVGEEDPNDAGDLKLQDGWGT